MTQEITHVDPLSTAKIGALLGILWAFLGWLFSGIVILIIVQSSPEQLPNTPPAFAPAGLLSGVLGGFIGGGVSGYLGSYVYNLIAKRIGGIKIALRE